MTSKVIVAVIAMTHLLEVNKTNGRFELSGGIEGLFLKDVLVALGVNYQLVSPREVEFGRLNNNGTWTGLVGMVQKGEAHLACGGLLVTEQRMKAVNFSVSYVTSPLSFIIAKAKQEKLKNAYLYPFQTTVWKSVLGLLCVMSTILFLLFHGKYSFGRILFELSGNLLKQPFMLDTDSRESKAISSLWWLFAIVISTCYSGTLLSFLTFPFPGETVETFRQLAEAVKKGTHQSYVIKGSLTTSYLLGSNAEHLQYLGESIEKNEWYTMVPANGITRTMSANQAIITNERALRLIYGYLEEQSVIFISKDTIFTSPLAIAVSHNFCCRDKLNKIILRIVKAGLLEKYGDDIAFKNHLKYQKAETHLPHIMKVSFIDLSGCFLLLVGGYTISGLILLGEILLFKYLTNRHLPL